MTTIDVPMNDQRPVRSPRYALAKPAPRRGLLASVMAVLLQPGAFFASLATGSRQWLLVALLILALAGFTAVRHAELTTGSGSDADLPTDLGGFPPVDGGFGAPFDPSASVPGGEFAPPGDPGGGFIPPAAGSTASASTTATWTTALIGASQFVVAWVVQAVLLCEVSLFNGRMPKLGRNLQIAVWASLPLALMLTLQLVYYSAGGAMGAPGLSGIVTEWEGFAAQTPFVQALLLSLASHLTIFGVWSLVLLYVGGRVALNGRRWAVLLVLLGWAAISAVTPVLTGAVSAPVPAVEEIPFDPSLMPLDPSGMTEGMPEGDVPVERPDFAPLPEGERP